MSFLFGKELLFRCLLSFFKKPESWNQLVAQSPDRPDIGGAAALSQLLADLADVDHDVVVVHNIVFAPGSFVDLFLGEDPARRSHEELQDTVFNGSQVDGGPVLYQDAGIGVQRQIPDSQAGFGRSRLAFCP